MIATTRAVTALVVICGVAAIAGCGAPAPQPAVAPTQSSAFDDRVSTAIAEAEAGGGSEAQIALLNAARLSGDVNVELARQARSAFSDCAAALGVAVTFAETTRPDGWVSATTWVDGNAKSGTEQIAMECERKESYWVTKLYDTQPRAEQATSDYLNSQARVLLTCLQEKGFEPDSDLSGMDLAMLAASAPSEAMRADGAQCLAEIGVDGF